MLIETDRVSQPRVVFFIVDSPPHSLAEEDVQLANQAEVEDNSLQPSAEEEVQSTNQAEDDESSTRWAVVFFCCVIGVLGIIAGGSLALIFPIAAALLIVAGASLIIGSITIALYREYRARHAEGT